MSQINVVVAYFEVFEGGIVRLGLGAGLHEFVLGGGV
jgi:hypothetical protein